MPSPESGDEPTVLLHGTAWKVTDIRDTVLWCLTQTWHRQKWMRSPALVHKAGGTTTQYIGQKFDPEKILFVKDGWTHDHCAICWWTLRESAHRDENEGYQNKSNSWLCTECFNTFIHDDTLRLKTTSEQSCAINPHASGTSGIAPEEQPWMPNASGDT